MNLSFQSFSASKVSPAQVDTIKLGNHYIPKFIPHDEKTNSWFSEMIESRNAVYRLWKKINETEDRRQKVEDVGGIETVESKFRWNPFARRLEESTVPFLNIGFRKGDFKFHVKYDCVNRLYMQLELSVPKFITGSPTAIAIGSDEWNLSNSVVELVDFVNKRIVEYMLYNKIPCGRANFLTLKRMDIFKDLEFQTRPELDAFMNYVCTKTPEAGFDLNVIKKGETGVVKKKGNKKQSRKFPRETIYNKTLEAKKVYEVDLGRWIVRDELRFDKTAIKNNDVLSSIHVTPKNIYCLEKGKREQNRISLNKNANKIYNECSGLKRNYLDGYDTNYELLDSEFFKENFDLIFDILMMVRKNNEDGVFSTDIVKNVVGETSFVKRMIKTLVEIGQIKRSPRRLYLTPSGEMSILGLLRLVRGGNKRWT